VRIRSGDRRLRVRRLRARDERLAVALVAVPRVNLHRRHYEIRGRLEQLRVTDVLVLRVAVVRFTRLAAIALREELRGGDGRGRVL
jgi:hypothetical protein